MSARTTLVTGATEGLGLHAARQLAALGHTVLVHGRTPAKVESVVRSLDASGGRTHAGLPRAPHCFTLPFCSFEQEEPRRFVVKFVVDL